jgi:predicted nucleic acid-binding protein
MPAFLPDTSCMIPAVCGWHEHHERAAAEIERRLRRGDSMVVAAAALVEAYAVLTRLPSPHRLAPETALEILEANFISGRRIIALDGLGYRTLLKEGPRRGISGGRIYDAVIEACARRGRVTTLLTFNLRDFSSLADSSLAIVAPAR